MVPLGLSVNKQEQASQGYTLFTPMQGQTTYLIDMRGNVVQRWELAYRPGDYGYLLENGNLLMSGRTNKGPVEIGGRGGIIMELDWDGNKVWEYVEDTLHHDFSRMDNGNTMVLGWEQVPPDVEKTVQGGIAGPTEKGLWCDYFREVTSSGATVWEWHGFEQLDPVADAICHLHHRDEWTHTNTCKVLPDGNIITSFRLLDTVGIISKSSGEFVWKWGRGELGHQHDPHLLENGDVLIFDNGWHSATATMASSRIIEIDPNSNEIQWEYKTKPGWDFFSSFISGSQRQPNGNTLICEGMRGRIFEVTTGGEIVWQYTNPFYGDDARFGRSNTVFRAYRYGPDFPGFKGKDLDPGRFAWLNQLYRS